MIMRPFLVAFLILAGCSKPPMEYPSTWDNGSYARCSMDGGKTTFPARKTSGDTWTCYSTDQFKHIK
jgi:hypothetical protein